jgi:hypothetical protein
LFAAFIPTEGAAWILDNYHIQLKFAVFQNLITKRLLKIIFAAVYNHFTYKCVEMQVIHLYASQTKLEHTKLMTLHKITKISTDAQILAPKLDLGLFRNTYIIF